LARDTPNPARSLSAQENPLSFHLGKNTHLPRRVDAEDEYFFREDEDVRFSRTTKVRV
jgi:hypothetical protein